MAGFGNIANIVGQGVVSGLGSAEEQRARQDAIMRFGLNLAQQQADLAERKRQHDLQYEPVDITSELNVMREQVGQPPLPPGTVKMPRGRAQGFPGAYAGLLREPPVSTQDLRRQMQGLGLDVPELPTQTIQAPGEGGRPSDETAGMPSASFPTAESQAILRTPVQRADIPLLRGGLEARAKANREAAKEAKRVEQVGGARTLIGQGKKWEDISAQFPLLTAKDVYGYEPAAPTAQKYGTVQYDENGVAWAPDLSTGKMVKLDTGGEKIVPATLAETRARNIGAEADRQATRESRTQAQIEDDFRAYQGQYAPLGAFDTAPKGAQGKAQPMSRREWMALTQPAARYKTYYGEAPPPKNNMISQRKAMLLRQFYGLRPGYTSDQLQSVNDWIKKEAGD